MRPRCGVLVLVLLATLSGGCSDDGGGRAEPKAGKKVLVAKFDRTFNAGGVAVDDPGTVYTSGWDGKQFVIAAFPKKGKPTRRPIPCSTTEGSDYQPGGHLVAAPDGTLFWSIPSQNRVVRVPLAGGGGCFAGTGKRGFSGEGGPALQAQLYAPGALAYDPDRNDLYFIDSDPNAGGDVVRKVDAKGVVTTAVGPEGLSGQHPGPEAGLYLAFDQRRGRLYREEKVGIAYRERDGRSGIIHHAGAFLKGLAVDPASGHLVGAQNGSAAHPACDMVQLGENGDISAVPEGNLQPDCAGGVAVDDRGDIWVVTDDQQLVVIRPAD